MTDDQKKAVKQLLVSLQELDKQAIYDHDFNELLASLNIFNKSIDDIASELSHLLKECE